MHSHQVLILGQFVIFIILAFLEFLIACLQGYPIGTINLVEFVNPYFRWDNFLSANGMAIGICHRFNSLIANLVGRFILLNVESF